MNKLKEIDVEVNADILTIVLLYSILNSYENFRCAIEARDTLPTAEALKIKLLEECEARKDKLGDSGNSQDSFFAKSKDTKPQQFQNKSDSPKSGNKFNKTSYECNYCTLKKKCC